jgi:AraC-like DNA-binding protein
VYSLDTQQETELEGWHLSITEHYLHQDGSNLVDLIFGLRNILNLKVPEENEQKLEQLFSLLQSELPAKTPQSGAIINSYLTILLSEFKKLGEGPSAHRKSYDPRFDEFQDLINKDFREVKDIESYAAMMHLSSKQLNRICKEASGRTAGWLLDSRIHIEASRLLHYTNRSVKEISYELGFGQPSYFIKFYRRISNKTPHQYRQYYARELN